MRMTNKKLVELYGRKKELIKESRAINKEINKVFKKEDRIADILAWVEEVNEIYKGVALSVFGGQIQKANNDDGVKVAHVMKDMPGKGWHIEIKNRKKKEIIIEGFKTHEAAMEAAKEWICFNKKPKPV